MIQLGLPLEDCNHMWYLNDNDRVKCIACGIYRDVRWGGSLEYVTVYGRTPTEIINNYRRAIGLTI